MKGKEAIIRGINRRIPQEVNLGSNKVEENAHSPTNTAINDVSQSIRKSAQLINTTLHTSKLRRIPNEKGLRKSHKRAGQIANEIINEPLVNALAVDLS